MCDVRLRVHMLVRERTWCERGRVLQQEIFLNCSSISKTAQSQWTWGLFCEIKFQAFLPSSINLFAIIIWNLKKGSRFPCLKGFRFMGYQQAEMKIPSWERCIHSHWQKASTVPCNWFSYGPLNGDTKSQKHAYVWSNENTNIMMFRKWKQK